MFSNVNLSLRFARTKQKAFSRSNNNAEILEVNYDNNISHVEVPQRCNIVIYINTLEDFLKSIGVIDNSCFDIEIGVLSFAKDVLNDYGHPDSEPSILDRKVGLFNSIAIRFYSKVNDEQSIEVLHADKRKNKTDHALAYNDGGYFVVELLQCIGFDLKEFTIHAALINTYIFTGERHPLSQQLILKKESENCWIEVQMLERRTHIVDYNESSGLYILNDAVDCDSFLRYSKM